jgi:hypothetical protein
MDESKSFLKDWIITFIKNRDAILRNLVSIEEDKNGFDVLVKYKNKDQFLIVEPIIKDIASIIKKFNGDKHHGLVVANTTSNFGIITENWDKLIKFKHLCIYFVNPFSSMDKRWLIYPYTHNKICDESSLKTGLRSMFDMVEPLTDKQIEVKFSKG